MKNLINGFLNSEKRSKNNDLLTKQWKIKKKYFCQSVFFKYPVNSNLYADTRDKIFFFNSNIYIF